MNYTNRLGEITELKCRLDFAKRGIPLSQPTNQSCRYDFIADIGGKLIRIQCKTCHFLKHNTIEFPICSINWNTRQKNTYRNDIDYFYTNWNSQGFLVAIDACGDNKRCKSIRLGDAEDYHSYAGNVLYSKDVKIDAVIQSINPDFVYDVIDIETKTESEQIINQYKCVCCGKRTSVKNGRCWSCAKKAKKSSDKPSRDELKVLIRSMPFTHIAMKYNRTDNAIRKWCSSYGLPTKSSIIKYISDEEWVNV